MNDIVRYRIPINTLNDILDPLNFLRWTGGVDLSLKEKVPITACDLDPTVGYKDYIDSDVHRIAYLYKNGWNDDPILIALLDKKIDLIDGWHRLCAATIRGDKAILAYVGDFEEDFVAFRLPGSTKEYEEEYSV